MPHSYPKQLSVDVGTNMLDSALGSAVQELIPEAIRRRTGISVTRLSGRDYHVAVDQSVPCGEIHEKCQYGQN